LVSLPSDVLHAFYILLMAYGASSDGLSEGAFCVFGERSGKTQGPSTALGMTVFSGATVFFSDDSFPPGDLFLGTAAFL
jgi:hypothetical protein